MQIDIEKRYPDFPVDDACGGAAKQPLPLNGFWVSNEDIERHLKSFGMGCVPGKSRTDTPAKLLQGAFGWEVGSFKNEWTLKLLRSGSKSQLPRGFVPGNRAFFVDGR